MRIAVIGAGISGLGAAWLLSKAHHVTVFERGQRLGGHSNTVDVPGLPSDAVANVPVDTGFIVYNSATYPNLIALFDHLGVRTAPSNMSFAVSLDDGRFEYSGSGLAGLFGQKRNIVSPRHWLMVRDILRFFKDAETLNDPMADGGLSLGEWLAMNGYSRAFIDRHLLPMAAAIWSTPSGRVADFPAAAFSRFFSNHGLLKVRGRPKWRTVQGGSRSYVRALRAATPAQFHTNAPVTRVVRGDDGVWVTASGRSPERFDQCVLAGHADETLKILGDADRHERALLGAFSYSANRAVLHRDPTWMPKRERLWSSWNYTQSPRDTQLSVTYWMNALQPLPTRRNWFVTLNPGREIASDKIAAQIDYAHPVFDAGALKAQARLWGLQGRRRTWFCGSYFGYGFHEDGLQSGLAVAEALGGLVRPWSIHGQNDRIVFGPQIPVILPEAAPNADVAAA